MVARLPKRLEPWIVVPFLVLAVVLFPVLVGGGEGGVRGILHIGLVGGAVVAAAGFGSLLLVSRLGNPHREGWDEWFPVVALVFSAAVGAVVSAEWDPFEIFSIGSFSVFAIGLVALICAAIAGWDAEAASALISTYLFGFAGIYAIVGWFFVAAANGAFD